MNYFCCYPIFQFHYCDSIANFTCLLPVKLILIFFALPLVIFVYVLLYFSILVMQSWNSDNYMGSNEEKSNTTIATFILVHFWCTNIIFADCSKVSFRTVLGQGLISIIHSVFIYPLTLILLGKYN